MKVLYPQPSPVTLNSFLIETNAIERQPVTLDDIAKTKDRKAINPWVLGQALAMKQAMNLTNNYYWPVRHRAQFEDENSSDVNLKWLRDLHDTAMRPIAEYAHGDTNLCSLQIQDVGRYRLTSLKVGMNRPLPKATKVGTLLHEWYSQLGEFHLQRVNQFHRPSTKLVKELVKAAYHFHIQLVCIKPFAAGNGYVGRIVENALRLRWGLPYRVIEGRDSVKYVQDIMAYEDAPEWQSTLDKFDARDAARR